MNKLLAHDEGKENREHPDTHCFSLVRRCDETRDLARLLRDKVRTYVDEITGAVPGKARALEKDASDGLYSIGSHHLEDIREYLEDISEMVERL